MRDIMMPKTVAYGKGKNPDPQCLNDENIQLRFFKNVKRNYNQLLTQIETSNGKEVADRYRADLGFLNTSLKK